MCPENHAKFKVKRFFVFFLSLPEIVLKNWCRIRKMWCPGTVNFVDLIYRDVRVPLELL